MSALKIPRQILDEMIAHARELDPFECCGLLAGKNGLVSHHFKVTNTIAHDPRAIAVFKEADVKNLESLEPETRAVVGYFMDTKELFRAFKDMRGNDLELMIAYHSHTHSPAYPSMTDIGLAYYPEAAYLIISLENKITPDLRAYWIKDRQVSRAEFQSV